MRDAVVIFFVLTLVGYVFKKISSREPSKIKFNFYFFIFYFLSSCLAFVIWPLFLLNPKNVKNAAWADNLKKKAGNRWIQRVQDRKEFATPFVIHIIGGLCPAVDFKGLTGAKILKHITKIYDLKWELRNGEILSKDRGAVIVSNHQSSLDVLGMFNIWEIANKMSVIAKKEVFYVWPFGLAAYLAGIVFIDRSNSKGAYEQLKITSDVMVKNKTKIWLFPEGTRNKDYTKLLPFKKGAFSMAVAAQVPIIPVVFSPYYFINSKKSIFNKGHVVIHCLEEIPTKGLSQDEIPELIDRVRSLMENKYKELTKEVIGNLPSDYPHTTVG